VLWFEDYRRIVGNQIFRRTTHNPLSEMWMTSVAKDMAITPFRIQLVRWSDDAGNGRRRTADDQSQSSRKFYQKIAQRATGRTARGRKPRSRSGTGAVGKTIAWEKIDPDAIIALMAEEKIEELTKEQLEEQLRTALESWPLYRTLHYRGAKDYTDLPQNIWLYCEKCKNVQRWSRETTRKDTRGISHRIKQRIGFAEAIYHCRNCPIDPPFVRYSFYWSQKDEPEDAVGEFLKVGQWPALEERVPDSLKKVLDKDDLAFYKNALRMRNYNLGIAAVAYLRRVVENRINDVLDVLAEAAQEHSFAAEELKKIKEVKASYRFDDKIEYAAKLLPPHLRPEHRPNPIDVLHDLTSDGLHSKSEEECVDIFDRVRKVFEYVFGNLNVQIEEARAFVKNLEGLKSPPKSSSKQKADRGC
jgi:hypothetical protein